MAKKPAQVDYDASQLKHLSSVEGMRQKPSMYLGPLGPDMVFTTVREAADNVVDEALNGHASLCEFFVDDDGSYWVLDDGRGMPTDLMSVTDSVSNTKYKMPGLQAITGLLHAGGKLSADTTGAYSVSRGCFHGDTQIRLLDGSIQTMEQIYARWTKDQTPIPILSYNLKKQCIEPSVISYSQITKHTKDLVEVKYDNGHTSQVTPDHPFYVRRGGSIKKVQAQHLKSGDSLVSTYYREDKGYTICTENGKSLAIHRIVGRHKNGYLKANYHHVHHDSRNTRDNRPGNIEVLTIADHHREHSEDRALHAYNQIMETQQDLRDENSLRFQEQNDDPVFKETTKRTKCLKVGVRAYALHRAVTPKTYQKARRHNDYSLKSLLATFGDFDAFEAEVYDRVQLLQDRKGRSFIAEDILDGKDASNLKPVGYHQKINSDKARILAWKRTLLKFPNPRGVTVQDWNASKKGAWKMGNSPYANLYQMTTLKALKAHVLDGEELKFHRDLSDEAMRSRAIRGELRAATAQKALSFVTFCVKRIRGFLNGKPFDSDLWAKKAKRLQLPDLDVMLAFLADYLEQDSITDEEVTELVENWNHTVAGVRHIKFKKAIPVYDITVDKNHTFFIEAGPSTTKVNSRSRVRKYPGSGVLVKNSHGVGIKGTNFTSEWFEVFTFFKGQWYHIAYEKGILSSKVAKCPAPAHPAKNVKCKKGTLVHWKPDPKIVKADKFPLSMFQEWATIAAYFTPGLRLVMSHHSGKTKEFYFEDGPKQYITDRLEELKAAQLAPLSFSFTCPFVDVVATWTDFDGSDLQAFTNGLKNPEKGVHANAFFAALQKAIEPFIKKRQDFTIQELKEGIIGLVNAKLSAPQFASQTKEKLVDERAGRPVQEALVKAMTEFFKKNKGLAEKICARAAQLKSLRNQFTASKQVLKELSAVRSRGLPAKAASSPNCSPTERELYLIEGDSAAGSAKMARNPFYQEALPLKGKIMNAMKGKLENVLLSEEVLNILNMIGFDPKSEDPLSKLRVGKILCLSDPDPDGAHINILLLSLFWKLIPGMFEQGRIYVAEPPEFYSVVKSGELIMGDSLAEMAKKLKAAGSPNADINHVKGYGELEAMHLATMAFNPRTRKIRRITAKEASGIDTFVKIMSDDVTTRKQLLGI